MRKIALIGCGAVIGLLALTAHYVVEYLFGFNLPDFTVYIAAAIAAPVFGVVQFDHKAFSRAFAEKSKLVIDRLGFRTCGVGCLSRPAYM